MSEGASPRRVAGLVIAAALSWLPLVVLVGARLLWTGLPETLTSHWNLFGAPDVESTPQAIFWQFLIPAGILAISVTAVVATVGDEVSRRGGAVGIGLAAWMLGTIAGAWFVIVLVALNPDNSSLYIGLLLVFGILFGALTGGAAALPRPQSLTPTHRHPE